MSIRARCSTLGEARTAARQDADAAAEIRAAPAQRRQVLLEQSAAGIDAVPAEDAGLGPEAEGLIETGSALGQGLLDPDQAASGRSPVQMRWWRRAALDRHRSRSP